MIAHAVYPFVFVMALIGSVVAITGQLQFWLLYLFSPAMLLIALLCGLGPLIPVGWVPGWGVGMPLLVSALLLDAGALWVHSRASDVQRRRLRRRAGGPTSELPALALWDRVRNIRVAMALGGGLLVVAILLFQRDRLALAVCLALLIFAAGCLRLDATLLGWLGKFPLVVYDEQRREWRATYVGRSALFVPRDWVRQAITPDSASSDGSAGLLALLEQSSLGPVVRRAIAGLSYERIHRLVLCLSLREGGAAAIRYLRLALPQPLRLASEYYAALADEAAKPLDLQRWIAVLASQSDWKQAGGTTGWAPDVSPKLVHTRDALLSYEYEPELDVAVCDLRQLVRMLYGAAWPAKPEDHATTQLHSLPLSWPVALLMHVETHRTRLLSE